MEISEFASEGLLPHSSCWEPESSWKQSFSKASFCINGRDRVMSHKHDLQQETGMSEVRSKQENAI